MKVSMRDKASHYQMPLQKLMIVFMLFIITTVVALNGWAVFNSHQQLIDSTERNAKNLSLSLARHAEDTFLQVDILLQDLQERIEQDGQSPEQLNRLGDILKSRKAALPQLHGIFIYDDKGEWVVNSGIAKPANANNADREYFKYHQNNVSQTMHIDSVIQSRSTGDLIIPVSMRINKPDGSFDGVLLATLSLNYFKQYYGYYSMGNMDVLAILLSDGRILYGRPYDDSYVNRNVSNGPLFAEHLKKSESGTATFVSIIDHIERIYGYTRLKRYPIVIAAGYDLNLVLDKWKADSLVYGAITLILLFTITLLGLIVLRQIRINVKNQIDLTIVRDELTSVNHTLQTLALFDGLTGLANRRQFDIFLQQTLLQAAEKRQCIALIMIDVDAFKKYNDHYGHVAGDECLRKIGNLLSSMPRRNEDLVARYGGEEFAIIITETDKQSAAALAQRALDLVREEKIPHETTLFPEKIVTISAGVYVFCADSPPPAASSVIDIADAALYRAKHGGKNRFEVSE
ncbi:sensor domain-containing diguanylate cyclase [Pectobacterium carotovorum]|uniref:diguanylate cyclase n=1 Tax=Pectobacterium carotovorum subsp. carotovorum TaxID=555 RepID=A0AAI9KZB1_PECCC|nr:sensor domain-containing diguanylate cyclase [Pectobacterium carotovorum]KHT26074.1 diguanylate cyclase [Pectobacterium carotovorum subsp. carotovorum]KHT34690.1 diguanylate cyclase [Pectobacterium carotovorum subsp. carotovorum]MBL0908672.1 GGDEF domain-containing protein [Pectobacterium carotovorum]MDK9420080.1 sensor domain-containing diguanylate cyclase [Pectobacterium carotovorum]QHP59211.1 GGDEF domain-containing protein [Pectobacterium carotovorum subsp. carotovorum]